MTTFCIAFYESHLSTKQMEGWAIYASGTVFPLLICRICRRERCLIPLHSYSGSLHIETYKAGHWQITIRDNQMVGAYFHIKGSKWSWLGVGGSNYRRVGGGGALMRTGGSNYLAYSMYCIRSQNLHHSQPWLWGKNRFLHSRSHKQENWYSIEREICSCIKSLSWISYIIFFSSEGWK